MDKGASWVKEQHSKERQEGKRVLQKVRDYEDKLGKVRYIKTNDHPPTWKRVMIEE